MPARSRRRAAGTALEPPGRDASPALRGRAAHLHREAGAGSSGRQRAATCSSSGYSEPGRLRCGRGACIRLHYRPGHFIVEGHPVRRGVAAGGRGSVSRALGRSHVTGPYRTLSQDLSFGIDQLVEIAIRALSPAVNDTFTALTCIDWLGDRLCKISARWHPGRVHRDARGYVRVITAQPSYARLVTAPSRRSARPGRACPP